MHGRKDPKPALPHSNHHEHARGVHGRVRASPRVCGVRLRRFQRRVLSQRGRLGSRRRAPASGSTARCAWQRGRKGRPRRRAARVLDQNFASRCGLPTPLSATHTCAAVDRAHVHRAPPRAASNRQPPASCRAPRTVPLTKRGHAVIVNRLRARVGCLRGKKKKKKQRKKGKTVRSWALCWYAAIPFVFGQFDGYGLPTDMERYVHARVLIRHAVRTARGGHVHRFDGAAAAALCQRGSCQRGGVPRGVCRVARLWRPRLPRARRNLYVPASPPGHVLRAMHTPKGVCRTGGSPQ